MTLQREHRCRKDESQNWARALAFAFFTFLLSNSTVPLTAQPNSAAHSQTNPEPAKVVDPLGRGTPRGAFIGFLKYEEREDFATAAHYLQPAPGQDTTELVQYLRDLRALRSKFRGNIDLLSDEPNGSIVGGLSSGEVRAGVIKVGSTTVDVILVQAIDPDSGEIWLISKDTVARIPGLYAEMEREGPTAAERFVPAALKSRRLLDVSLAQWLGWLVSIPISWFLAWLLEFLLSTPHRVWCTLRKLAFDTVWKTPLGLPLRCIVAILVHGFCVYLLDLPLLYRAYYARLLAGLLVGCFAWFVTRISDRGFSHVVNRTRTQHAGGESILIVLQRIARILILLVGFVGALAALGLNVTTTLAGLGIGGLALALGAQKSLENILGGVTLLMDKAVHVGNFCKIGNQLGTVEDIGLRSVKLRTLDQSLLIVPNGSLAQMQFENFGPRRKCLINQRFSLRIETQVEQLKFVLDRVQSMLDQHPAVETGTSRVRVANFAGAAFELELWAFVKTADWGAFTVVRQDVILKIAEIVDSAGARLAAPTQLTYLSSYAGLDTEKANEIARRITDFRTSNT